MTLQDWVADLRTSALVGTARRDAPPPPPLPQLRPRPGPVPREQRLLELAALADVLSRSARTPRRATGPATAGAPPETVPEAGDRAGQLLGLLLLQPPMPKGQRDLLVVEWLETAAGSRVRAPFRLLVPLLELAASRPGIARSLHPAAGERGRWLTGLNPAWADLAPAAHPEPAQPENVDWSTLPAKAATEELGRRRAHDPEAARTLLTDAWDTLSARERRAHLGVLRVGLATADEQLLELALDDRARSVRDEAAALLDLLPASARAARMAQRLRPLVSRHGTLRRSLRVEVPDDPDPAAVRDGLTPPSRTGEPDRLAWLRALVHAAPLEVWTDLADGPPARAVSQLRDEPAVLDAIRDVVLRRRDRSWAPALLEVEHDDALATLLPAPERERRLLARISAGLPAPQLHASLRGLPTPWGDELARRVVALLVGNDGDRLVWELGPLLPTGLPSTAAPHARQALERLEPGDRRRDVLAQVVQYHSFRHTLTEAFR